MSDFYNFSRQFLDTANISALAQKTKLSESDTRLWLEQTVNESELTLSLLKEQNLTSKKILEFGAGSGLVGAYLWSTGIDVTSLEPGEDSFEVNKILFDHITAALAIPSERRLNQKTDAFKNSKFDLIFSNNVLEHVAGLDQELEQLTGLLVGDGLMIHNCPNYIVPFEPHFGIPLVPFAPRLSAAILPKRIRESALWKSLQFVTTASLNRHAKRLGFEIEYRTGTMAQTYLRLRTDPHFARRHPTLRAIAESRLGRIAEHALASVPPTFSTPMISIWRRSR